MVVLPSRFISELNKLPQTMINSRLCHAYSMTGHLNGMNIVLKTNLHVRVLHNRITSALPDLLKPVSARIGETIKSIFTQNTDSWNTVEPMDLVVYSVSRGVSLANVGAPLCDDPDFIRLICEHTKNGTYESPLYLPLTRLIVLYSLHSNVCNETGTSISSAFHCMAASIQVAATAKLEGFGTDCVS